MSLYQSEHHNTPPAEIQQDTTGRAREERKHQRLAEKLKLVTGVALLVLMFLLIFCLDNIVEPAAPVAAKVQETTSGTNAEAVVASSSVPPETETEPPLEPFWTEEEVSYLTKTVYGSAGVVESKTEQSAVVWCILNWCDLEGQSIIYEVTYPNRFQGYRANNPEPEEIRNLVIDVLERWQRERAGATNVGRTLPPDYYFFVGDGERNHFRTDWEAPYVTWNWSLPSPYDS